MGHRDQASTQGTAHGCMDRQEQATHVPRQTWGSMVSLGGVFTFRSLLSLCCGVRNLSRAQLSNLTPLCGSISGSHTAQALRGAEEPVSKKWNSQCRSLSTEPPGPAGREKGQMGPPGPRGGSRAWDTLRVLLPTGLW